MIKIRGNGNSMSARKDKHERNERNAAKGKQAEKSSGRERERERGGGKWNKEREKRETFSSSMQMTEKITFPIGWRRLSPLPFVTSVHMYTHIINIHVRALELSRVAPGKRSIGKRKRFSGAYEFSQINSSSTRQIVN